MYAGIGRGASKKSKGWVSWSPIGKLVYFRPEGELSEFGISGYFSIYYHFKVDINLHGLKESYYNRVVSSFVFSRMKKELFLMEAIAAYFNENCIIRKTVLRVDVNVYGLEKLGNVVSLFKNFPLTGLKQKEFLKWAEIVNLLIDISWKPYIQGVSLL